MAERDWLGELAEAIGDDPAPPRPEVPDFAGFELAGPGRDLDGWAEELAEAVGTIPADLDPSVGPAPPSPAPPTPSPEPTPDATPDAAVAAALVDRLTRVEAILGADLDKLGPAVLAGSIAALDAELGRLRLRLAEVEAPVPPPLVPPPVPVIEVVAPPLADEVVEGLGALHDQLARIDERLLAQSRYLVARSEPAPPDPGIAALVARVEEALEPEPPRVDPQLAAVAALLTRLGERVDALAVAQAATADRQEQLLGHLARRLDTLGPRVDPAAVPPRDPGSG